MRIGQKGKERLVGAGLIALAAGSLWLGMGKADQEEFPILYLALLWGLSLMAGFAGVDALAGGRISGLIFREKKAKAKGGRPEAAGADEDRREESLPAAARQREERRESGRAPQKIER